MPVGFLCQFFLKAVVAMRQGSSVDGSSKQYSAGEMVPQVLWFCQVDNPMSVEWCVISQLRQPYGRRPALLLNSRITLWCDELRLCSDSPSWSRLSGLKQTRP